EFFMERIHSPRPGQSSIVLLSLLVLCLGMTRSNAAVTGTFVLATTNNTVNATNSLSAWQDGFAADSSPETNNLWALRSFITNHWESYSATGPSFEDSPLVKTTVTGLPLSNYFVRVIYMARNDQGPGEN